MPTQPLVQGTPRGSASEPPQRLCVAGLVIHVPLCVMGLAFHVQDSALFPETEFSEYLTEVFVGRLALRCHVMRFVNKFIIRFIR